MSVVQTSPSSNVLNLLKNAIVLYVVVKQSSKLFNLIMVKGPVKAVTDIVQAMVQNLITASRRFVPGADSLVRKEVDKTIKSMQANMTKGRTNQQLFPVLPARGLEIKAVREELIKHRDMASKTDDWKSGRVSGAVYHGGDELSGLITESFGMFTVSNPLHPDLFPGVRKMESEIISMVLKMYNAPEGACGNMTSGGTESIIMALKTYREWARVVKGITEPEIVVPETIHAAFDKGADYFNIKLISIPTNPITGKVDVEKMARAITSQTIMIAGSSPNFPHGMIDDIPALAALAKKHKIGMHVDACLGGFIVPFAEKAGFPLPHFVDFRVDGVTSISCDTHKYGFAPKGSSVIMYRSKDLRNHQYFILPNWPGGVYASPTMAGSRPGALIAGCWAVLVRMGEEGYIASTRQILYSANQIKEGIRAIPELKLIGDPLLSVIAFASATPSIKTFAIGDILSRKHWHLNMLQRPDAIHIACTYLTTSQAAGQLLADIKEAIELLKKDPEAGNGEVAAIYGTVSSVPDRSIIADVSRGFLDGLTLVA